MLYKIKKKSIKTEAEFILDEKKKEEFLNTKMKEVVKSLYSKNSSLSISFSSDSGIKFLDKLDNKIIPEIDSLHLTDVSKSPGRFEKFMVSNFPLTVNCLNISGKGMSLVGSKLGEASDVFLKRIKKSINFDSFIMPTENLSQLLNLCRNLTSINLNGCSLNDRAEIELKDMFWNLESLNLEGVGLTSKTVEAIVMYLIHNKIISHLKHINLYHEGMENLLLELENRLINNGYTGSFKKLSNWVQFVSFLERITNKIASALKQNSIIIAIVFVLLAVIAIYKFSRGV